MTAIMDDKVSIGPPDVAFPAALQMAVNIKEECGIDFRPDKSCAYMRDDMKPHNWDELRGNIPEGKIEDDDGSTYHGMSICNIPIGHPKYVETYLEKKKGKLGRDFRMVEDFLDTGKTINHTIPVRKMQFLMILASLQFCGDYWNQHLTPASTGTFARDIDVFIRQMVQKSTGVDFDNVLDILKERLRLPIC